MKCEHHPGAPAVGDCQNCVIPICGICATHIGESVLCERCESVASTNEYVEQRSNESNKSQMGDLVHDGEHSAANTAPQVSVSKTKSTAKRNIQLAVTLLSGIFIVFQISISARSGGTSSQEEIAAEERTRDQIQACMLIFWEIATQLNEGQQVDRSLRCEETDLPLLVVSEGDDLRVSHPRPEALGLTGIYVLRSNPVPILLD